MLKRRSNSNHHVIATYACGICQATAIATAIAQNSPAAVPLFKRVLATGLQASRLRLWRRDVMLLSTHLTYPHPQRVLYRALALHVHKSFIPAFLTAPFGRAQLPLEEGLKLERTEALKFYKSMSVSGVTDGWQSKL